MTPNQMQSDDPLSKMDGIGPYLTQRLLDRQCRTVDDLLDTIEGHADDLDDTDLELIKEEFEQWLSEALANARPNQCSSLRPRMRDNREYAYMINSVNRRAWDNVVLLLRNYFEQGTAEFALIPALKQDRQTHQAYPIRCRVRRQR